MPTMRRDPLIDHVASTKNQDPSATAFGTSHGAIVAMTLLSRHPNKIAKLISHELPVFSILPDPVKEQAEGLTCHAYDVLRAKGPIAAMNSFASSLSEGIDGSAMRECINPEKSDEIRANLLFWFEFELRQYPCLKVDVSTLAEHADKCIPVAGITSGADPGVGPVTVIAGMVKKSIARIPDGHVGYMTNSREWTESLRQMLDI